MKEKKRTIRGPWLHVPPGTRGMPDILFIRLAESARNVAAVWQWQKGKLVCVGGLSRRGA